MAHRTLLTLPLLLATAAAPAGAADRWVAIGDSACADTRTAAQAASPATPWCTLAPAAHLARAGDVVRIRAGSYRGSVRPETSGTPAAPIRFAADEPGVVLDAAGAANAVKLIGVSDVAFAGMEIRGGAGAGVWIDAAPRARLTDVEVRASPGAGIAVRDTPGLVVERSTIAANGSTGILEHAGTTGARYRDDTVTGNGRGGSSYNGDGLQLAGTGALVSGALVTGNGDPGPYEHGIYTAASSSGWTIERSVLRDNGSAAIKAAGGPGTIRLNHIGGGRYGIVLSDNPAAVTVEHNALDGPAQHLVFATAGATPARARLWSNTIVQSGRSTGSGDASAVFVNAAAVLELRDNLLCYDNADTLGVALWVNDVTRLDGLVSNANWLCGRDTSGRDLAWNGSRTTLAGWRSASGQDDRSLASTPPAFDADLRVTSANLGADRGDQLGLPLDLAGAALPQSGQVDVGAYQASRAASPRAAMCAIAWIEICGLTPEAVGKAEPSST